jgi:hypothetical protein
MMVSEPVAYRNPQSLDLSTDGASAWQDRWTQEIGAEIAGTAALPVSDIDLSRLAGKDSPVMRMSTEGVRT